jgi:hypothetical protein
LQDSTSVKFALSDALYDSIPYMNARTASKAIIAFVAFTPSFRRVKARLSFVELSVCVCGFVRRCFFVCAIFDAFTGGPAFVVALTEAGACAEAPVEAAALLEDILVALPKQFDILSPFNNSIGGCNVCADG